jgi:hypothetical protein
MGCFQSNWHLLLLLLCYQTLGILAMGTTTPIPTTKNATNLWPRFTTGLLIKERDFETTKEDSIKLYSQFVQKTKNKKTYKIIQTFFCVGQ